MREEMGRSAVRRTTRCGGGGVFRWILVLGTRRHGGDVRMVDSNSKDGG